MKMKVMKRVSLVVAMTLMLACSGNSTESKEQNTQRQDSTRYFYKLKKSDSEYIRQDWVNNSDYESLKKDYAPYDKPDNLRTTMGVIRLRSIKKGDTIISYIDDLTSKVATLAFQNRKFPDKYFDAEMYSSAFKMLAAAGEKENPMFKFMEKVYDKYNINTPYLLATYVFMQKDAKKLKYDFDFNYSNQNWTDEDHKIYKNNKSIINTINDKLSENQWSPAYFRKHKDELKQSVYKETLQYIKSLNLTIEPLTKMDSLKIDVVVNGNRISMKKLRDLYLKEGEYMQDLLNYYIVLAYYYGYLEDYWNIIDLYKHTYAQVPTYYPEIMKKVLEDGAKKGNKKCKEELKNFNDKNYPLQTYSIF